MFEPKVLNAAGETLPADLFEVEAPWPLEISGVAAIPGGYAVVGDEEPECGRIWPGGVRFALPGNLKGPESIDVGFRPDGEPLWLVLGEKRRRLIDLDGGQYEFDKRFKEKGGRGLEGVAVRWRDEAWQVAVVWEGGFFDWKPKTKLRGDFRKPKVAIFNWEPGEGPVSNRLDVIKLEVPMPSDTQRFRASDLVWDGDSVLVLLTSTDKRRQARDHTWLQRFDLAGQPVGEPFKLEERWGRYSEGKNWEAMDWTLNGDWLVLGYDTKDVQAHRALAVFAYRHTPAIGQLF